jgi:hypothetical protein
MDLLINKDYMLHLDLYVKDCSAEFYINDIPIRHMNSKQENTHSLVIHHLLKDDVNTFEAIVWPGDTPSKARSKSLIVEAEQRKGTSKVCMQLVRYPVGAFAGDTEAGEILMQLNWEFDEHKHGIDPYPVVPKAEYDIGNLFGIWNWQQCSKINLTDEATLINRVVEHIYQEFSNGNGDAIARLATPYLVDMGKALPAYGTAGFTDDMINDINYNKEQNIKIDDFDLNNLDVRLCGNDRLVQLIDHNWEPTVRTTVDEDGESYELPIFLGKLQNQWFIVA